MTFRVVLLFKILRKIYLYTLKHILYYIRLKDLDSYSMIYRNYFWQFETVL